MARGERARLLAALEGLGGTPDPAGPPGAPRRARRLRGPRRRREEGEGRSRRPRRNASTRSSRGFASAPTRSTPLGVPPAARPWLARSRRPRRYPWPRTSSPGRRRRPRASRTRWLGYGPGRPPSGPRARSRRRPPSRAARRIRDDAWKRVGPALTGERPVEASDASDASALDRAIPEADRLADDRWSESSRAARNCYRSRRPSRTAAQRVVTARRVEAERSAACELARGAWAALLPAFPSDDHDDVADALETLRAAHDTLSQRERLRALGRDRRRARGRERRRRTTRHGSRRGDRARRRRPPCPSSAAGHREPPGRASRKGGTSSAISRTSTTPSPSCASGRTSCGKRSPRWSENAPRSCRRSTVRREATAEEARSAVKLWREVRALLPSAAQLERRVAPA